MELKSLLVALSLLAATADPDQPEHVHDHVHDHFSTETEWEIYDSEEPASSVDPVEDAPVTYGMGGATLEELGLADLDLQSEDFWVDVLLSIFGPPQEQDGEDGALREPPRDGERENPFLSLLWVLFNSNRHEWHKEIRVDIPDVVHFGGHHDFHWQWAEGASTADDSGALDLGETETEWEIESFHEGSFDEVDEVFSETTAEEPEDSGYVDERFPHISVGIQEVTLSLDTGVVAFARDANPTTGYLWEVLDVPPELTVNQSYRNYSPTGFLGASGFEYFHIFPTPAWEGDGLLQNENGEAIVQPGYVGEFIIQHRRPWVSEPVEISRVIVNVV